MTHTCFEVEIADKVAHLRMCRPEKANSMIPEFWSELPQIVDEVSDGTDARVIVLSAEGRHFCSGMDLAVFGNDHDGGGGDHPSRTRAGFRATALRLQRTFSCLEESRLPVLSAVQGACMGGGINMISGNGVVTNSAMLSREGGDVHTRLRASNGANLQFIASTLSVANADCPSSPSCFVQGEGAITATAGSRIVLRESAVGVGQPSVPGALLREASGGDITADPATWIQPVNSQPAGTLRTLTDQPGLLTDPPGLPNLVGGPTYWPDAVTPINPGQLIDAIPDAGPNGANALVSPVSGNLVSLDALGNPRISANGTRTIGAVQVSGPQLPPTPTPAVPVPGLSLPGVIVLIFMLLVGARLRRRAR